MNISPGNQIGPGKRENPLERKRKAKAAKKKIDPECIDELCRAGKPLQDIADALAISPAAAAREIERRLRRNPALMTDSLVASPLRSAIEEKLMALQTVNIRRVMHACEPGVSEEQIRIVRGYCIGKMQDRDGSAILDTLM